MKTFKRVLAMSLALALLLSFSPTLGVNAAEAEGSAYNQLMHDYKPTGLTYDLTDSTNYATPSGTKDYIAVSAPDSSHLLFDNYTAGKSTYVTLRNQQTNMTSIILEFDFCYEDAGLRIDFTVNGANFKFANFAPDKNDADIKRLTFQGSNSRVIEAGKWYKLTLVCNVASKNSIKFDGYIDKVLVADDVTFTNTNKTISAITTVRAQVNSSNSNTKGENGDFQISNVNWYIPNTDENKCTDANDDHICDYDMGCEPVSVCEDADNDGYCDHTGCSKRTEYTVTEDDQVFEITASGVLNLNGKNATVKVAEGATLAVVDTSWMTNGLSGEKAAKLTVDPESKGTVETYTQYGDFKYLKVPGEDGTYTFHPFNLTITRMGLNTVMEAISLEVQFVADDVVRDLLIENDHNYGLKNGNGVEISVKENSAYQFTAQNNRAVAYFATDSLHNDNFDTERTFQAYMKLKVGNEEVEILSNYKAVISPRKIMTDLNNSNVQASPDQLTRIREMLAKPEYSELANVLTRFKEA